MRPILAACLAFLCGITPALAQGMPITHAGYWTGGGVQPDGQTWHMVLTLYGDGAIVDYPGIPCAAYWSVTEAGPTYMGAFEHLAAGFDLCEDGLAVWASIDAKDTMTVSWTYADGTAAATAWLMQD